MKPEYSFENVSKITGVPAEDLKAAADLFARAKSANVLYSMGITQHTTGVDNVKSIANLQMLTGNLGRPGAGICAAPRPEQRPGRLRHGRARERLLRVPVGHRPRDAQEDAGHAWGIEDIAEGKVGSPSPG